MSFQGNPCWYELTTSQGDLKVAGEFYARVLGWAVQDSGMPDFAYHLATSGGDMRDVFASDSPGGMLKLLARFRGSGDANARAIWLFSRNDAIGNLAVVVAAVLVWALSSSWPDLLVAFAVAGLFLQSAWSIIRDARSDLKQAGRA